MNAPSPLAPAPTPATPQGEPATPDPTAARSTGVLRRALSWVLIGAFLVGAAFLLALSAGSMPEQHRGADPESHGPSGTRALAEILRAEGVHVEVVRSRAAAMRAVDENTTLVFSDPAALSDNAVLALVENAPDVVITSVSTRILSLFDLGTAGRGVAAAPGGDCARPELAHVGSVQFTRPLVPGTSATGCFPLDAGEYGVLTADRDTQRITVVEASRLFGNEWLSDDGNAALGLALLGQHERVVWYVPSVEDTDLAAREPDSLGSHTPGWVTPVIVLLLLSGIVAGIWRGRRFGPLVHETLPVTVRASETMMGRARLTARAHDTEHAAQALREGTMRRMALRLGLPASHSARVVADAAADRLAAPRDTLRTLFDGPLPTNEGDLVAEARALHQLEAALENTAPGLVHGGHSAASGAATSSPAQGAPTRPTPEDPTERSTP